MIGYEKKKSSLNNHHGDNDLAFANELNKFFGRFERSDFKHLDFKHQISNIRFQI